MTIATGSSLRKQNQDLFDYKPVNTLYEVSKGVFNAILHVLDMAMGESWNPGFLHSKSFFKMSINCKVLGEGKVFPHHLGIHHLPLVSHKTNAKPTNIFKSDLVGFKLSSLISRIHIYIYRYTYIHIYIYMYTTCLLVQEFPNVRGFQGRSRTP